MLANLPKPLLAIAHGLALAVLFVTFGGVIFNLSVDLAAHYELVNEIMKHGYVRPEATYLGPMMMYPNLSHWIAAVFGWLTGSGLIALGLLCIAAIYIGYFAVLSALGRDGSIASLVLFAIIFAFLNKSHSLMGHEVVRNFFYPQLIGFVVYIVAISVAINKQLSSAKIAAAALALNATLFLIQPIAGVHLTGAVICFLALETLCLYVTTRQFRLANVGLIFVIAIEALLLARLPKAAALISYSANNGALGFEFPGHAYAIPFIICAAVSVANLTLGARLWPNGMAHRLFGAAGTAAALLMLMQLVAWVAFKGGSPYAVKKHGFFLVTFGVINLAQLLGCFVPKVQNQLIRFCTAVVLAFFITFEICASNNAANTVDVISAQRFANNFVETSPDFSPQEVSSHLNSLHPTLNLLIQLSSFERDTNAVQSYGELDVTARYVMIDRTDLLSTSCAVAQNSKYAIVPPNCVKSGR